MGGGGGGGGAVGGGIRKSVNVNKDEVIAG